MVHTKIRRDYTVQGAYTHLRHELIGRSPRQMYRVREQQRALDELGPVVYYAYRGDLIKIGYTTHLRERMAQLKVRRTSILAIESPGTLDLEALRHVQFASSRVLGEGLGREHYKATPHLLAHINEIRDALGVPCWLPTQNPT